MSKKFDATLKELFDHYPLDWVKLVSRDIGLSETEGVRMEPLDADLSTISPQADKLFRLSGSKEALLQLELQSGWDGSLPDRCLLYSVLAEHRYSLPVFTAVILLERRAEASSLTGHLVRERPDGKPYLTFAYSVMRIWQMPAAELLDRGIGTLPLALLTDEAKQDPEGVYARFHERVDQQIADNNERAAIYSGAYILMGLRFDREFLNRLFRETSTMRESSTYQGILQEGRDEGLVKGRVETLRQSIRDLGEVRFGPIPPSLGVDLDTASDPDRLARVMKRVLSATGWEDLMATP